MNWGLFGLSVALLLVLFNGFFVAAEFALVKVRPTRLRELSRGGSARARSAQTLVAHLDEALSATQLGITLASLGLGWIGEPAFAHLIAPAAARLGLGPGAAGVVSATAAFASITLLHIVFGELAPKSLAIQRAEGTALWVAAPMRAFTWLFRPFIWSLNGLARLALRPFGIGTASAEETVHSEEELRFILAGMRAQTGRSLETLERALDLPAREARELMVPRDEIHFLRAADGPAELRALARTTGHGRYPLVEDDIDHVVGIVTLRDVVLSEQAPGKLLTAAHKPLFVPEAMKSDALLREMARRRQRLAIVVDEYGGTAGLVTLEDIVMSLLGHFREGPAAGANIVDLGGGRFQIDPRTPLEEVERRFHFEAGPTDATSIGGLVMERLARIPAPGDRLAAGPLELAVEEMDGPRMVRLAGRLRGGGPAA